MHKTHDCRYYYYFVLMIHFRMANCVLNEGQLLKYIKLKLIFAMARSCVTPILLFSRAITGRRAAACCGANSCKTTRRFPDILRIEFWIKR